MGPEITDARAKLEARTRDSLAESIHHGSVEGDLGIWPGSLRLFLSILDQTYLRRTPRSICLLKHMLNLGGDTRARALFLC